MTNQVFVIEELRTDSLENAVDQARYYVALGFVIDEAVAQRIVREAGVTPKGTMWAIFQDTPNKRYRRLPSLDSRDKPVFPFDWSEWLKKAKTGDEFRATVVVREDGTHALAGPMLTRTASVQPKAGSPWPTLSAMGRFEKGVLVEGIKKDDTVTISNTVGHDGEYTVSDIQGERVFLQRVSAKPTT